METNNKPLGLTEATEEEKEWFKNNSISYGNEENSIATFNILPSEVDNSKTKYFPKVINQTGGSCTSYSITYYQMTYMLNKYYNRSADSDENICSPKFTYNLTNHGTADGGACPEDVYKVLKEIGVPSVKEVPLTYNKTTSKNYYTNYHANNKIWLKAGKNRIDAFYTIGIPQSTITNVNDSEIAEIKSKLNEGDILSFNTLFYSFVYDKIEYNSSIPGNNDHIGESIITRCKGNGEGPHEMTIVGYNDNLWCDINEDNQVQEGEMGAFKIVNSHGTNWANDGFCWVSYDALNATSSVSNDTLDKYSRSKFISGQNYVMGVVIDEDDSNNKEYYAKIVLNSNNRGQAKLTLINETKNLSYLVSKFNGKNFENFSFDGLDNNTDGELYINLENVVDNLSEYDIKNDTWMLRIEDTAEDNNITTVKEFSIVDGNDNTLWDTSYNQNTGEIFDKEYELNGNYLLLKTGKNADVIK